ncbi:hypothetical protein, partial [Leuconostoc mesenteroides]|uniref:hypothetical protein n=2 Tax=Leuconostoc mesenteroides TaxID=1245 RepID=UPI001CC04AC8
TSWRLCRVVVLVAEFKAIYNAYLYDLNVTDIKWTYLKTTLELRYFDENGLIQIRWRIKNGFVLEDTKKVIVY